MRYVIMRRFNHGDIDDAVLTASGAVVVDRSNRIALVESNLALPALRSKFDATYLVENEIYYSAFRDGSRAGL